MTQKILAAHGRSPIRLRQDSFIEADLDLVLL